MKNNHIISTSFPLFWLVESVESPFFMELPLFHRHSKGRCCCGTRRRTPSRQAIQTWCPFNRPFAIGAEAWNSMKIYEDLWTCMKNIAWTFNVSLIFSTSGSLAKDMCAKTYPHNPSLSLPLKNKTRSIVILCSTQSLLVNFYLQLVPMTAMTHIPPSWMIQIPYQGHDIFDTYRLCMYTSISNAKKDRTVIYGNIILK